MGEAFWSQTRTKFGVGDISKPGGGKFPPHKSHQKGLDVDIRPIRKDCKQKPVRVDDEQYDRSRTVLLILLFLRLCEVDIIGFQDDIDKLVEEARKTAGEEASKMIREKVRPWDGHRDHLHIRLKNCE